MLGGEDGHSLFITSSESDDPQQARRLKSGRIEQIAVDTADQSAKDSSS
jgi:hypothetical protein